MQFIILGCGSSMGVPRPDGFFGNCDPNNKKNYRTRCSALIKTTDENILIDTSPDLRQQLLRHKIKKINKVLFSHMHGDQTHGINDLRSFYINSKKQLDVYADKYTSKYLNSTFSNVRNPTPEDILDMSHTEKKWQLRICHSKTREPYKTFSEVVDQFSLQFLHNSIEKFASIATGFTQPQHHNSKAKCNACNLKASCEFRL